MRNTPRPESSRRCKRVTWRRRHDEISKILCTTLEKTICGVQLVRPRLAGRSVGRPFVWFVWFGNTAWPQTYPPSPLKCRFFFFKFESLTHRTFFFNSFEVQRTSCQVDGIRTDISLKKFWRWRTSEVILDSCRRPMDLEKKSISLS